MPRLEVLENKKLVLKNTLCKELKNLQIEKLDEEISKFGLLLERLSVQTFGPLIMRNAGISFADDGEMTMDHTLIIQARDYKQYKNNFSVFEQVEVPNSVYVRFEGASEDLHFAHSKLDLYFYENELEPTGETYSVIIDETENNTIVDIFKPVKRL